MGSTRFHRPRSRFLRLLANDDQGSNDVQLTCSAIIAIGAASLAFGGIVAIAGVNTADASLTEARHAGGVFLDADCALHERRHASRLSEVECLIGQNRERSKNEK